MLGTPRAHRRGLGAPPPRRLDRVERAWLTQDRSNEDRSTAGRWSYARRTTRPPSVAKVLPEERHRARPGLLGRALVRAFTVVLRTEEAVPRAFVDDRLVGRATTGHRLLSHGNGRVHPLVVPPVQSEHGGSDLSVVRRLGGRRAVIGDGCVQVRLIPGIAECGELRNRITSSP